MRSRHITLYLVLAAFLSIGQNISNADEKSSKVSKPSKTSWSSFRNGEQQRGVAGSKLPDQLELLWTYDTEFGVSGTACIVGDHIYVPTIDGLLLCLNRDTGSLIWKYRSIESDDPKAFAPGFKAAPLITDQFALVGDEDGVFHSVNRMTGMKVWSFASEAEIAGGANLSGDKVIFGSHDSHLYCLNLSDGKLNWKFQTQDRVNLRSRNCRRAYIYLWLRRTPASDLD